MGRVVGWGSPLLLAALSLTHPIPAAQNVAESLAPVLVRWQAVHIAGLAVFPLVALGAYRLLPTEAAAERSVARLALAVFAISAAAFDSLVGLGTGSAVAIAGQDPAGAAFAQAYFTHRVVEPTFWIVYVGTAIGWLVGIGAVAVGLWRQRASTGAVALLIPAAALAIDHIPPFGVVAAIGLLGANLFVAFDRRRTAHLRSEPGLA